MTPVIVDKAAAVAVLEYTERVRGNITRMLSAVADEGRCKGCQAAIFWIRHKNGKATPYDVDLTNHFITCPKAKDFKSPRSDK